MSRIFQIHEEDLTELEHVLPGIFDLVLTETANGRCMEDRGPELRTKWRKVQQIITNVRWNYGPPEQIEIIPRGEDQ